MVMAEKTPFFGEDEALVQRVLAAVSRQPGEVHDLEDAGIALAQVAFGFLCSGPHGPAGAARLFDDFAKRARAAAAEQAETDALPPELRDPHPSDRLDRKGSKK